MFVVAWTNRRISLKIIHLRDLGQSEKRFLFQCLWHTRNIYNNKMLFFRTLCSLPSFVFFEKRRGIPRSFIIRSLPPLMFPANLERGRGQRIISPK